jgi:hypothetical protein
VICESTNCERRVHWLSASRGFKTCRICNQRAAYLRKRDEQRTGRIVGLALAQLILGVQS